MPGLIGIGVGPGDVELLTVKAVKAIQNADIIMCPASKETRPSIALSVVSSIIDKSKNQEIIKLIFPMTKDKDILEESWKRNAKIMAETVLKGKNVVYLTVGDPYLYSTWIYMHRDLKEKYPDMNISVVPGIVSIFSFASKVGVSVAEGAEKVAIIPSCYDLSSVKEIARHSESMIFLKDGRYFDQVIEVLKESGFPDDSLFAIGQDLGTENEIIRTMTWGEVNDESLIDKSKNQEIVKLIFPMTKDKDILEAHWKENSKIMAEKVLSGNNVVYLTVGDPYLYSTWIYMHREIRQNHPEMKITVIPGIVSMFTFASKVGVSIAEGAEKVAIIPSCYDLSSVKEIAKNSEVLVFLKDGRYFDQVIELLKESGFPDNSIFAIGQDLGTENEIIRKLTLGEVNDDTLTTKYFSILVVKRV